jgi:prolyl oligopeptidase
LKQFVAGGFELPEAKSGASWRDRDTLYVATDFGAGSLTSSGYPRVIKEWRRGTALANAAVVYEGQASDVAVGASVIHDRGRVYEVIQRAITFYSNKTLVRRGDRWVKIEKPDDAEVSTFDDQLLLTLRSDWEVAGKRFAAGSLLSANFEAYLRGERTLATLFEPNARKSLAGVTGTRHHLLINELENVRNRLYVLTAKEGRWDRRSLEAPGLGTLSAWGVDADSSDEFWLSQTDFLTPSSLFLGTIGGAAPEKLKSLPAFFASDGLRIDQFEATSRDGTRVPYFQVSGQSLRADGQNVTLLEGYGGFEVSMTSGYNAGVGAAWLEHGHVYVLANIRGGGEFGPSWHQSALKANRQRAYDDFIAVAEDLIRRKVTSPRRLGITGGSNGGLLMGNMLVQRPDLFGAISCWVPLLDMRRFNQLLAGASWMGEYGNPDLPEEWEFLQKYSPYHRVNAKTRYPRALFITSTRDDRVHPGHARKMVARMKDQGHAVLYYENVEGGHGAASNNPQRAFMNALSFTYLESQLAR